MHKKCVLLGSYSAIALMLVLSPTHAADVSLNHGPSAQTDALSGDAATACAAILCLSAGSPPQECSQPLSRFFRIKKRRLANTLSARETFLKLCPTASSTAQMRSLIRAQARGAGRCDAATFNRTLRHTVAEHPGFNNTGYEISNRLPSYCAAWIQHEYVRMSEVLPRYVGTPEKDGFWVDANRYAAALARYQREQVAKESARASAGNGGH